MKYQIGIILLAVFVIVGLYSLPKVVVSNEDKTLKASESKNNTNTEENFSKQHSTLSSQERLKLDSLKKVLGSLDNREKKANFASQIAKIYKSASQFDSSAYYLEMISNNAPNLENWIRTGDAYYEAFQFAINANKAQKLGKKARKFYTKVLDKMPKNLRVRANLAMTYTATSNPMQGISMLKNILEEDSKNELAIFNLGILSMQSGQYQKAVDRFETLLKVNPNHIEAKFFLGESFANLGEKQKAIKIFKEIASLKTDTLPRYKEAAERFIQQLQKN